MGNECMHLLWTLVGSMGITMMHKDCTDECLVCWKDSYYIDVVVM